MLIPESLWQPVPKDLRAQFAPIIFHRHAITSGVAASATATLTNTIPLDYVLYLTHVGAGAAPNAGFNTLRVIAQVTDRLGTVVSRLADTGTLLVGTETVTFTSWQGNIVLFREHQISVTAIYSGVTAGAHNTDVWASGVLVPRGNWQFA